MTLADYQNLLRDLRFGKRLPTAVYVYHDAGTSLGPELDRLIQQAVITFQIAPSWNVLKFRTDELKVSFLSYPDFFEEPHPILRRAVTVDLVKGRIRDVDYADNPNPPILHRKETFLPPGHPMEAQFASLTAQEEAADLYAETATIGFKLNWERLLASKGLAYAGHQLVPTDTVPPNTTAESPSPPVDRHKTALTRYDLSKPIRTLLEYGQLRPEASVFDYGCGQGTDVAGLRSLGYRADGWDPVHRPATDKTQADVVNLGYVINVIEDPVERLETLVDAFRHARRLLVVSALISETVDTEKAASLQDGVLTRRNTFQKYFNQQELQQYVEDALDCTAVPVALGIFYVFRDPADQQDFLSARSRRSIDWAQISARLGLGGPRTLWKALYEENRDLLDSFGKLALDLGRFPEPNEFARTAELVSRLGSPKRALRAYVQGAGTEEASWDEVRVRFGIGQPAKRRWEVLYDEHRELLDSFWNLMLQLGRLPEPEEFPQTGELREKIGSPKQALRLFIQKGGAEDVRQAAENRKRDLLVYVALANLRKRVPFGHLSLGLRSDIRAFFGNYSRALEQGMELLYAAADPGEIELACEGLELGWQDEQALYIHRSLLNDLPPVLRAYVGCATALFGDVSQADVIKLHKSSGKVTFLAYDDFEGKPLPELKLRFKVNLRTRWVQVFDHGAEGQLLYFKERYLAANHPKRGEMAAFSGKLLRLGIAEGSGFGPNKAQFLSLLDQNGLNHNLNKRRARMADCFEAL